MFLDVERPRLNFPVPQYVDFSFCVKDRVRQYESNNAEIKPLYDRLQAELARQDVFGSEKRHILAARRVIMIEREMRYLEIRSIKPAIEINPKIQLEPGGYATLRRCLVNQFADLTREEKIIWLRTFIFMTTPDIWAIYKKIEDITNSYSIGQMKNLMISSQSGMGKSSLLDYLASHNPPYISGERTIRSVIKMDIPPRDGGKNTLPQRLVLACGVTPSDRPRGDSLFDLAVGLFSVMKTVVLFADEVENLCRYDLRRRFVDFSNSIRIPIVCATCNPELFTRGDQQVEGRWGSPYIIQPFTGKKLLQLLGTFDMLLPFPKDSGLALKEIQTGKNKASKSAGPATLIEDWTGGNLLQISRLIIKASTEAILEGEEKLTIERLRKVAGKKL